MPDNHPYLFKRALIKLSGEALAGDGETLSDEKIEEVASVLKELQDGGLQMGVVIGGGNIYRGRSAKQQNRSDADHMGMLATVINALSLKDALLRAGARVTVMSAIAMEQICDFYTQREAIRRIERGEIVIFAAGIGRPYFSTDTASAMRALEIDAEVLVCGKNVDGIYDEDPRKNPNAKRYDYVSYEEFIEKDLKALDQNAIVLCRDNGLKVFVFELKNPEKLIEALSGEIKGSVVGP